MIQIHFATWVLVGITFGLLVLEPPGWDWVAYAFGGSVLIAAVTAFAAVPVATIAAVQAVRSRRYGPAVALALIAGAAVLSVSVWLHVQMQRP